MRALQHFERRLEGAVEGFFARAFRSGLQPIELAKGVQRYAEDHQHVTSDGVVVPNVFRAQVAPKDYERLSTFGESLPRELAQVVVTTAVDRGWQLRGPVKVRVEPAEKVKVGRYTLTARVEVVDLTGRDAPEPARATSPPGGAGQPGQGPATAGMAAPGSALGSGSGELAVRVLSGPAAGTMVSITRNRVTLGRMSSCDVTVADSTVSREHAALVRRGDRWWIVDLGSTNGTTVNGVRAAEQPVGPGDRIVLGDAAVELVGA